MKKKKKIKKISTINNTLASDAYILIELYRTMKNLLLEKSKSSPNYGLKEKMRIMENFEQNKDDEKEEIDQNNSLDELIPDQNFNFEKKFVKQIKYYLSHRSLVKNDFLSKHLKSDGFLPLNLLFGMHKIKMMMKNQNYSIALQILEVLNLF
mgnify:CR=1 FL=1